MGISNSWGFPGSRIVGITASQGSLEKGYRGYIYADMQGYVSTHGDM